MIVGSCTSGSWVWLVWLRERGQGLVAAVVARELDSLAVEEGKIADGGCRARWELWRKPGAGQQGESARHCLSVLCTMFSEVVQRGSVTSPSWLKRIATSA